MLMTAETASAKVSTPLSMAIIIIAVLFGPAVICWLTKRVKVLGFVGPVFLSYVLGIGLSFLFTANNWDAGLAETLAYVAIPLAIPLILFNTDLLSLKRLAKPMLVSFILVCVSVFAVSSAAYFFMGHSVDEPAALSGMLIGLYTGGTPNLNAIGAALKVNETTISLANASDFVVGGVYFLILLAVGPTIAKLSKPSATETSDSDKALTAEISRSFGLDNEKLTFRSALKRIPVFLLALGCVAVSMGLSWIITKDIANIVVVMLVVTTLGLAFSFIKGVRTAPGSYNMGQYLIYVFSVGIGMLLDINTINGDALRLLGYIAAVQFASIALHFILSAIFRIKAPTAVITSVAGVFGPAFIVPVANSMKNREIVLPGLICGILGYAIGNFLGIGTAFLLGLFG